MLTVGQKLRDVDRQWWTVQAVKEPADTNKPGLVHLRAKDGTHLTIPWLWGTDVTKSKVWITNFGDRRAAGAGK